jgi:hypothetical protein
MYYAVCPSETFVVSGAGAVLAKTMLRAERCAGWVQSSICVTFNADRIFALPGNMTPTATRFSRVVRGWIFAAALAQAFLPGVVSVIDSSAAGSVASAAVRPHAEDHEHPKCPRVHQEDNCALCQFVSAAVAPAAEAAPLPVVQSGSYQVVRRLALAASWLTDGSPSLPRAPPALA